MTTQKGGGNVRWPGNPAGFHLLQNRCSWAWQHCVHSLGASVRGQALYWCDPCGLCISKQDKTRQAGISQLCPGICSWPLNNMSVGRLTFHTVKSVCNFCLPPAYCWPEALVSHSRLTRMCVLNDFVRYSYNTVSWRKGKVIRKITRKRVHFQCKQSTRKWVRSAQTCVAQGPTAYFVLSLSRRIRIQLRKY